jgi:hypothetical protein
MENKEICEKIRNLLSKERGVIAIFNNGSSIAGMNTPNSDLDFVLVLRKDSDKEKIVGILRKNYKIFKNEENPEIEVEEQYNVLGKRVDFTFKSKKEMEDKIHSFYKSKENFLESQHFIKHKIVDSISIYDPNNLLVGWKKEVERYPKEFMKKVFDSQIYAIKENLYYWKNHGFRNEFQFGFEQWDLIKAICQAIYAKNNKVFMLPFKRLHKDLKELNPNIEKEMYQLIRGTNNSKNISKKIKIVEKIISKLER